MSPSKILFLSCVSFILGIFLESIVKIPQLILWVFLFMDFMAIVIFFLIEKNNSAILGFCLLFLIIGVTRVQISDFTIANDKLAELNGKGQVTFTGIINDGPDIRDTTQKLKVKVGDSTVLVTADRYPEYNYLDTIKVKGKLEAPAVYDDFNYKDYLLKDGIYSIVNFPKIVMASKVHQYNLFSYSYEKILYVKDRFSQSISDNFLPPQSLILKGIILGDNKNITPDLRDKLNNAGLRFLTAISGVHVVILSAILISLMLFLGLRRNYAFCFSIIFIWLYIVITGFSASGIRAAIMGSIFIFAGVFGRQNTSSRVIVLAAALMLLQNPLLLIYDIGFQLSFMASLGIIYLNPLIGYFLKYIFKGNLKELADIISITFTAQIFTLPIMIYNFGTISLVAPITNILILPVMPWILSFGFLFTIFASVSMFLGWIFYMPCWLLITYFIKVMDFFSQPWMAKSISNVPWIWLVLCYAIIGFFTWLLNKKYSKNFI